MVVKNEQVRPDRIQSVKEFAQKAVTKAEECANLFNKQLEVRLRNIIGKLERI